MPKAPFPDRLAPTKRAKQFDEIKEVFQNVHINIPFLSVIQQIPSYAKFLKDLGTVKRRTNVPRDAFIIEQATSIIQQKGIVKYKDPGRLTVSCMLGDKHTTHALLNLGASVNLLPYSLYKNLGLKNMKLARVTLQLADRSVKVPRGIVEDVLSKVSNFYYPVYFIVLDTQTSDDTILLILDLPFLATANALINFRNESTTLTFGNLTVEFVVCL